MATKKTIWTWIVVLVVIIIIGNIILFTNFPSSSNVIVTDENKEPIKFGYIGPLSGPGAAWGETELDAVRLAAEEINAAGGINGRQIKIIPEDGKCSGKDSTIVAHKLVNIDDVKIIFGGACSSETLAIAPITEEKQVLLLTGISSNPGISDAGEYIFRLTPTDEDFFRPEARYYYNELGYRKVGLLMENTDYCISGKDAFVNEFEKLGGEIVEIKIANPDERDYRTYITKIKSKNPEAIVLIPQTPVTGGLMAKQIKELWDVQILGSYSMESVEAIKASEGGLNGAYIYSTATDIPPGRAVIAKHYAKYGKESMDNFLTIGSWDRVFIAKQAIEACGETDTNCMKDYIYSTTFNLGIGEYEFNSEGDIKVFYIGIYKIENNEKVAIESGLKVVKE